MLKKTKGETWNGNERVSWNRYTIKVLYPVMNTLSWIQDYNNAGLCKRLDGENEEADILIHGC